MDLFPASLADSELWSQAWAFLQIILIDLTLSGENAIVIGMAAGGLPPALRKKAIILGILAATVLRILFALFAVQMMKIIGLTLAGGLLLCWVAWKLFHQLRHEAAASSSSVAHGHRKSATTLRSAVAAIVVADVSMSLDNVLGVAGAARDHLWILVFGLALSIVLMGSAAAIVVRLLERWRWIGYLGFLVVLFVALRLVWDGAREVRPHLHWVTLGLGTE